MEDVEVPPRSTGDEEEAARGYVRKRIEAGASPGAVVQELVQRGMEPGLAQDMVGQARGKHAASARKTGLRNLLAGIVITLIATALTIASYSSAIERGSGTYFICCGLILFGLALTVTGVLQLITGRERQA